MKERLPQHDLALQKRTNELDLVTTTHKCRVKLFSKTENGRLTRPVDSVKAIEHLESLAIKKYLRINATKPRTGILIKC